MKPFALLAVLGALVVSAQAYSKCNDALLKKIKENLKETPIDLKVKSLLENGESIVAANTISFFPIGTSCVKTKLGIDDKYCVTTYDITGKPEKQPEIKLEKDDKCNEYYTKTADGIKVYSIPFIDKSNVIGLYTCSDKEPKKMEDHTADAVIRIRADLTKGEDAKKAIEKAKGAVEEAKKFGSEKYEFKWELKLDSPEDCLKKIQDAEKKKN